MKRIDESKVTDLGATRARRLKAALLGVASASVLLPSSSSEAASAYAFGLNQFGQIGNGTSGGGTTGDNSPTSPVRIQALSTHVTAVAAGGGHSLAVDNGALFGWGYGSFGQIGSGTNQINTTPVPSSTLTSGVTSVQAGLVFTLALANGGVYMCGFNSDGEAGDGTNGTAVNTPTLVPSLNSGVTAISAGQFHALALQSGALYSWGATSYGQCGNGSYTTQFGVKVYALTPVSVPEMGSGVTAFAAGGEHSLAVRSGAVYGWGHNNSGQVGIGSEVGVGDGAIFPTPQPVQGLSSGATDVSAGNKFSLALVNGTVYAWGSNEFGQLGDNSTNDSLVPIPVSGISGAIVDVEAGTSSSYALCADHSLWSWGSNKYGQLGIGSSQSFFKTPQQVPAPLKHAFRGLDAGSNSSHIVAMLSLIGDANDDGRVNTIDFDILATNFNGSGKVWEQADFNGDGFANALDFNAIATYFGTVESASLPAASLNAIAPEPSSLALLVCLKFTWARRRRG